MKDVNMGLNKFKEMVIFQTIMKDVKMMVAHHNQRRTK